MCWTARLPKTHAFKHTYEEGERIDTYSFRYDVEVHNNKPLGKSNKIEANVIWIQVHNNKTLGERNTFTKKRGCANCTKIYMRRHAIFDLHEKFYGTYNTTINPWGDVQ